MIDRAIHPETEFQHKLDRCGYLLARYRENKPWIDELSTLKDQIRERYATEEGGKSFRAMGEKYYIDLTVKEEQRKVTSPAKAFAALRKAVGLEALLARITITLKLIDEFIPTDQQGKFIIKERTGSRDLSAGLIDTPQVA